MSSFSDKAKQVLATVAPMLGTALGGPFGALAGTALASVLGTKPGDNAAAEQALLNANPQVLADLKKAEEQFQVQMKQLDITEESLTYNDTDSARKMEMATKDTTPRNLAYFVLGGTAIAIGATLAGYTHVDSALAGTLIGYMISECKAVFSFYFGTSASSRSKDDTIASIAQG